MTEEIDFIARFEEFLKSYKTEEGDTPYHDAIGRLSLENLISVSIDFNHLLTFDPDLAAAAKDDPKRAIDAASAAIRRILRIVDPDYSETIENLHARFKEVPDRVSVRFIRAEHIGQLIMVDALVTRVSDVKPLLVEGVFQCRQCQEIIFVPQANQFMAPPLCTNDACRSKGPFELIPERSKFVDWQKIRLQEKPEELPPGALPRALDCILQEDLVDIARPGDPGRVVGILRSTQDVTARSRRKAPTFSVFLATNYVEVSEREADRVEIEPKEEEEIRELAQDPLIHRKLVNSIAPSIYGLTDIKEAVCLLLFGGVTKTLDDGMKIRGDSNILLVGDPGTAKSQLLKYVAQIAPRGLYTSGKGSTAAGLTAAVLRDPDTEGFALEAGALVLADRGTACIDEFDKMRPQDRTAIHEAMEQHTVSIAKAGIVATLNARTAILAAANPNLGRYVPERSFSENINLPVTLVSRFDLIFVLTDLPETERDERTADHIIQLHQQRGTAKDPPIRAELLRKYIAYARRSITPTLTDEALNVVKDFYLGMRKSGERENAPVPITARQLESLIRLAEAHAKMALREKVLAEDAQAAVRLVQVTLQELGFDRETGQYDIDNIMIGRAKSQRDRLQAILVMIRELEKETPGGVSIDKLEERAQLDGISADFVRQAVIQLRDKDGLIFEPRPGKLKYIKGA
ncbi:MAG: minichromosome maintenance protein MCM [Candidatus Hermodarchaeia archaeon]